MRHLASVNGASPALLFRLACAALLAYARWPSDFAFHCTFKTLTGLPCATCGTTRAWIHFAHGDVGAAVVQSPLGSVLFVVAALVVVFGPPPRTWRAGVAPLWIAAGFALNWIYSLATGVA